MRTPHAVITALVFFAALLPTGCEYKSRATPDESVDLSRSLTMRIGELSFHKNGRVTSDGRDVLPGDWAPVKPRQRLSRHVCGSDVWIRAPLPATSIHSPVIFFPVGSYMMDFDLYLDGVPLQSAAREDFFGMPTLPVNAKVVPLQGRPRGSYLYLRFQKVPAPHAHVAINDSFFLASERSLLIRVIREEVDRLVLGFIFIFSGLMSLLIFVRLRVRDRISDFTLLGFVIMSVCMGLFTAASSNIATVFFVPPELASRVTMVTLLIFPIGLFLFVDRTLSPGRFKLVRRSWQAFVILSVIATIAILLDIRTPPPLIIITRGLLFAVGVAASAVVAVKAIMHGRTGARIVSAGLMIFAFYTVSDFLMKLKVLDYRTLHFHWGYLILQLLLGYLIYRAFEKGKDRLRQYSEELEEKSAILQDLNRTLEERVQERTEELREKNRELDETNRILADRNLVIENEIAMARRIQQQLIPASPPYDFVSSLYRPMDQVGGDFFDFIVQDDPRKAGIFISDVSGHGIPAALITSMIKTIILQAGERRHDPAALFSHINGLLYGKTVDNFITAFYGIIDSGERTVTFCNAGHNPPLIIADGRVTALTGGRSLPLAAMDNPALESVGKGYANMTLPIPFPGKLLLFTDGLTEATGPSGSGEQFEDAAMAAALETLKDEPCGRLVPSLYRALVDYRGKENFDDDVCILCVDLA